MTLKVTFAVRNVFNFHSANLRNLR